MSHPVKSTDAAIAAYHAALKRFADHSARHEGATETAFSRLLADTGKRVGWTLIPKKGMKVGGKHIAPDGTFQDDSYLSLARLLGSKGRGRCTRCRDHQEAESATRLRRFMLQIAIQEACDFSLNSWKVRWSKLAFPYGQDAPTLLAQEA